MPEKRTLERAKEDLREGKSPSTAAGEFVHEEIEHVREGKHGARSPQQAIAIGLSKARRAGIPLPPPKSGSKTVRERAEREYEEGQEHPGRRPSARRSHSRQASMKGNRSRRRLMRLSPGRRSVPLQDVRQPQDRQRPGRERRSALRLPDQLRPERLRLLGQAGNFEPGYPHTSLCLHRQNGKDEDNQGKRLSLSLCNGRVIFQKERITYGQPKNQERSWLGQPGNRPDPWMAARKSTQPE